MNKTQTPVEWSQIKGKIAAKWSKLEDADIENAKGDMDLVTGKIQKAYGYSREQAEQEMQDFNQSVEPQRASSKL